ncbi:major facilitator superfamily domain-containing protein 12-like isoform X2 [Hydractinia symbiolongicarpus]|uniref:major facilitator superfamily domain-containing protein 12-like isoform X2 n=1 Tax=Hydractinia symbiolongicarpus TaxID=13093 RepID=UPI00254ED474|nr:major facilitator superfamily domain-containing protein 12-like isoform X2 [Hydractinia symbiolongicarpus]
MASASFQVEECEPYTGPPLRLKQKIFYGVGHVLNDLCANCWFSYMLVYMSKVAGLTESTAGLLMLIGQIADGLSTLIVGYGCDRTRIRWYGKRKLWHGIGTICVLISFPFIFNSCLPCSESSEVIKLMYYSAFVILFQFGWAATQIGHLSLIPEISKKESQRVELNSIRSGLTFACGIFIYGVVWFLLGTTDDDQISTSVSKQFMILSFIVVGVGFLFSLIFHVGTKEPQCTLLVKENFNRKKKKSHYKCCCSNRTFNFEEDDKIKNADAIPALPNDAEIIQRSCGEKTWRLWCADSRLYKNGLLYMCTRLTVNIFQLNFPYYLTDALHFNKLTYVFGCILVISATVWLFLAGQEYRNTVYGAAWLAGSGCSVILVTSLAKTAELIGKDKNSSAFVYSTMSFTDKMTTGFAIFAIQTLRPAYESNAFSPSDTCNDCELYSTIIQTSVPGVFAFVGLLTVVFLFPSDFKCIRKRNARERCTQTDFAEEEPEVNVKEEKYVASEIVTDSGLSFTFEDELCAGDISNVDEVDTLSVGSYVNIDASTYFGMAISFPDLHAPSWKNMTLINM